MLSRDSTIKVFDNEVKSRSHLINILSIDNTRKHVLSDIITKGSTNSHDIIRCNLRHIIIKGIALLNRLIYILKFRQCLMKSEVIANRISRAKQLSVNLTISAKERMLSNLELRSDSVHHISKGRMTIDSYTMIFTIFKKNNRVRLEMLREHSIELTLEVSFTTTLIRQSQNKLREPRVLRLLVREFLNHSIKR